MVVVRVGLKKIQMLQLNSLLVRSPMVMRITLVIQVIEKIQMKGVQDSIMLEWVTVLRMQHVIFLFRWDKMLQGI